MTCRYGHNPDYLFDETKTPTPYFEDLSIVAMNVWDDPVVEVLKSFNAVDFIDSGGYIMMGNVCLMISMNFKTLDGGDFSFEYCQKYEIPASIKKLGDAIGKTIAAARNAS